MMSWSMLSCPPVTVRYLDRVVSSLSRRSLASLMVTHEEPRGGRNRPCPRTGAFWLQRVAQARPATNMCTQQGPKAARRDNAAVGIKPTRNNGGGGKAHTGTTLLLGKGCPHGCRAHRPHGGIWHHDGLPPKHLVHHRRHVPATIARRVGAHTAHMNKTTTSTH